MLSARANNLVRLLQASAGPAGALAVTRCLLAGRLRPEASPARVSVPMKRLGGEPIIVRPRTSDLYNASWYYLDAIHRPPPEVRGEDLQTICELGSNIGAALTALAFEYPNARILGVEPDPGNAAVARENLARFGDRCEVAQVGVWDRDAELVVDQGSEHGAHGFTVRERTDADPAGVPVVSAQSIDSIFAAHLPDREIDYLHVSIEGTEPRVLEAGGDWARRTRSLRMELHPYSDFTAEQAIGQLDRLGFDARPVPELPEKWVYALRRA
jgi:FkbM family methyltransferase